MLKKCAWVPLPHSAMCNHVWHTYIRRREHKRCFSIHSVYMQRNKGCVRMTSYMARNIFLFSAWSRYHVIVELLCQQQQIFRDILTRWEPRRNVAEPNMAKQIVSHLLNVQLSLNTLNVLFVWLIVYFIAFFILTHGNSVSLRSAARKNALRSQQLRCLMLALCLTRTTEPFFLFHVRRKQM